MFGPPLSKLWQAWQTAVSFWPLAGSALASRAAIGCSGGAAAVWAAPAAGWAAVPWLTLAGFASTGDAQRLCGQIRGAGGVCFVRASAGDASIRWAARYANPRQRDV